MIVVDNTVLVDFWVGEPEYREAARLLFREDSDWSAPDLWRYEFGNVIRKYARLGRISEEVKEGAWKGCLRMVQTVHEVDVLAVDQIAEQGDLKFYDASYVWLATETGIDLRTRDRRVLSAFPDVAKAMPTLS